MFQVEAVTVEALNRVLIAVVAACLAYGVKVAHMVYQSLDKRIEKLENYTMGFMPDRQKSHWKDQE